MKAVKKLEESSRKSWLVTVGVYSESVNKTADKLDKLYVDGNAFVNDLVARGEAIEAELKGKLNDAFKGKEMIEDKIAMLKAKLGMQSQSRDVQLELLSNKVDNLIEVVAKLAQQKAAEKAKAAQKPEPAPKASAPAKAAAKPAAESKLAAAAKPAAKKPAAKKPAASTAKTSSTTAARKPRAKKATAAKPAGKSE